MNIPVTKILERVSIALLPLTIIIGSTSLSAASPSDSSYPITTDIPLIFSGVFNWAFTHDTDGWYSARNTEKVWTIDASKILSKYPECAEGQVIKKIRDDGTPECGSKVAHMLVKVRVKEGGVIKVSWGAIWSKIASQWEEFSIGYNAPLSFETTNAEWTLEFVDDYSIIRLDTNTKVKLSPKAKQINGTLTSIAQATLENGLLWGRVLNENWMDFNNWWIIAWVRGTSIVLNKSWGVTQVYDSRYNDFSASISMPSAGPIGVSSPSKQVEKDTKITNTSTTDRKAITTSPLFGNPNGGDEEIEFDPINNTLHETTGNNKFIPTTDSYINKYAEYTKKDIAYMNTLQLSDATKSNIVGDELTNTEPQSQEDPKKARLCGDKNYWYNQKKVENMCQPINRTAFANFQNYDFSLYTQSGETIATWSTLTGSLTGIRYGSGTYTFPDSTSKFEVTIKQLDTATPVDKIQRILTINTEKYIQIRGTTLEYVQVENSGVKSYEISGIYFQKNNWKWEIQTHTGWLMSLGKSDNTFMLNPETRSRWSDAIMEIQRIELTR